MRLNFPAVAKLVGAEFFDGAAGILVAQHPLAVAYLDDYSAKFPDFLKSFQPAASLVYIVDVACLEWAVSRAIRATDCEPLDLARLSALGPEEHGRVSFVAHPSIASVAAGYPADAIWRATLNNDDKALAAVDLKAGPAYLLVERRAGGVEVTRLDEAAWRFAVTLCAGRPIEAALAEMPGARAYTLLAEHLAAGRFVDFRLLAPADVLPDPSMPASAS